MDEPNYASHLDDAAKASLTGVVEKFEALAQKLREVASSPNSDPITLAAAMQREILWTVWNARLDDVQIAAARAVLAHDRLEA